MPANISDIKPELQLSRAAKQNLEENIRQRKAHSKRDMAKFAKEVSESELSQFPSSRPSQSPNPSPVPPSPPTQSN